MGCSDLWFNTNVVVAVGSSEAMALGLGLRTLGFSSPGLDWV